MNLAKRWAATAAVMGTALVLTLPSPDEVEASPLEDEPGYSCADDGNRVCGPGNSNGVPAGCYDDGGVLVAEWPCEAWKPSDGYRHGDGSMTWPEGCQINLYTEAIDCSGNDLGPDWDNNPAEYFV